MGICVPEKALHEAWQRSDGHRAVLDTDEGDRYRVLYPGMPGGSFGPDFRDAVFEAVDGSEVQGDVEVHRRASEWYTHGHDLDVRYGGVVFHAVAGGSKDSRKTVNGMGMTVPEIDIGAFISEERVPSFERETCQPGREGDGAEVDEWLDAAGDERFALKVGSQRVAVESFGPDLALQMAIFEALGYPRNRAAFRHLAKRLPWAFLAGFGRGGASDWGGGAARAEDLLRWGAGFGEKPHWVKVPRLLGDEPNWVAAAGRPANRVETRLKAAARFVAKWWRIGGPLRHALSVMDGDGAAARMSSVRIGDGFVVEGGLVGRGRAGEIVINAVLPTVAAWAEIGRDRELYATALRLYASHPSLPSNSVFEEAVRVLVRRGVPLGTTVRGARRQQGVMHIYRSMLLRPKTPRQMRFGHRALSS